MSIYSPLETPHLIVTLIPISQICLGLSVRSNKLLQNIHRLAFWSDAKLRDQQSSTKSWARTLLILLRTTKLTASQVSLLVYCLDLTSLTVLTPPRHQA